MANQEPRTGRESAAELLRLQTEQQQADMDMVSALERGDRPEAQRLRYRVTALRHDIAALRFDLMAEQQSREAPRPPAGGGPGWMGMVQNPRKNEKP